MRRVLGYIEGRPIWSDNVPASSGSYRITGSAIVSSPGAHDREQANKVQRESERRLAAQREAA